jgi:hypothetical protein
VVLESKGEMIGQGNTAEIFEWGNHDILKLYRSRLPEKLCTYEFEVTKYVYEHLKIAPKPIELIHIDGRIGAIYERLSGKTMLKLLLSKPWSVRKYSKALAHCHVAIQKSSNLSVITVKEKLRRDIENVVQLTSEEKLAIYKYLDTLPDGDCICHFDFHPDNIIVHAGEYFVIDWMTGCIGDPLSDVARTALILNYAEVPRVPILVNKFFKMVQKRIYKFYLSEYLRLTGTCLSDIQKWEMPIAAARLCEWIPESESRTLLNLVRIELGKGTISESRFILT